MAKRIRLKKIGITLDGKIVVQGVFELISSKGIPLDFLFDYFKNNNISIDWIDFYKDSLNAGWNFKTLISKLKESLIDIYGLNYQKTIIERLIFLHNIKKGK